MKENIPLATLIIAIYNKIEHLKLILAALDRQSFTAFEVIIADDGSKAEVVEEIKRLQSQHRFPITHVWQEDIGFRKTRILNEAIRRASTDYLIFIDGDCIPHRRFIEEHYKNREMHKVLAGRRVNLSQKLSEELSVKGIENGMLDRPGYTFKVFLDSVFGTSTHTIKGLYVRNSLVRRFLNRKTKGVLGCNFSIHKADMESINGFDERYEAPAVGEDTDIELRLHWNNITVKMIKNMAIQYHYYHKLLNRSKVNDALFEEVKKQKEFFTPFGLKR